jgi:hypothetical protein|tara:strand:- start:320 stop:478 length:159 start_codon:yes stop_codon:yes gene_type:complete
MLMRIIHYLLSLNRFQFGKGAVSIIDALRAAKVTEIFGKALILVEKPNVILP